MKPCALTGHFHRRPFRAGFLLFLVAGFALFANSFDSAWTYDDFPVIVNNPDILSWSNFLQNSYAGRPLRELTFLFDHALFGMNPMGWHVQQIFWHALNAFLLYALLVRLAQPLRLALLAAGIFLVHPLTVEVVANISHRKDSLVLAFLLLAVHAYLKALQSAMRWPWLLLTLCAWGGALLAKENALVLPAILLLMEWTVVPREQRLMTRHRFTMVSFPVIILLGAMAMFFLQGGGAAYARAGQFVLSKLNVFGEFSWSAYGQVLLKSWLFMLMRLVVPASLAVEYTYAVPSGWLDPWVAGMLMLIGGGAVVLIIAWKRWPLAAFALGWAFVLYLPVANLWPGIYFAADRYLYAPLAGIAVLAAWLALHLASRFHPAILALPVVVLALFALLTLRQNNVWETEYSLWSHAVAVSPDSVYALNNLGVVYGERKDWQKALELIGRAAQNPYYFEAQQNMAQLQQWLGNKAEAERYRQRAGNPHAQGQ